MSRDIRLRALRLDPNAFCSTLERELAFDEPKWRDRLENGATFLARTDEGAVGTASGVADPHEDDSRELVAMWVDPVARGSGVAAALIESVEEWARNEGVSSLALWVADDNDAAKRLYSRCGFVATGEREPMRPTVEQLRMRRNLA